MFFDLLFLVCLDAKGSLPKQFANHFGGAGQGGVERGGVFAAGFRHVWSTTARTADLLREGCDDFAGGEAAG